MGEAVERVGIEAHRFHQLARAGHRFLTPEAEVHRPLDDEIADGDTRVHRAVGILEDDLHAATVRPQLARRHGRDLGVAEIDLAFARVDQPGDAACHGRLARTGFAHDAQRLTPSDVEVDVHGGLHNPRLLEEGVARVDLAELLGAQDGLAVAPYAAMEGGDRRHRGDQHLGVGLNGPRQDLLGRAHLHQLAPAQDGDAMGDLGDDAEIVGDEQHAGALARLQLGHELQDLGLGGDVERRGGLVGDQQDGIEHQRHGDHDALALAAGELVRERGVDPLRLRQLHAVQDGDDLGLACCGVEAGVGVQNLVDLLAAGHDGIERRHRFLEDHRHARAAQLAQPGLVGRQDVLALEQDLARGRLQRLGQQAHDGEGDHRLARAGFAHEADDLTGIDGEAHLFDGMDTVAALGQGDAQVADFEDGPLCFSRHQTFLLILGSSVSRRPSPMMLMASTVKARKMPG